MKTLKLTQGFTLIELLIVVLVIGVLASIAIPAGCGGYTTRAKVTEGIALAASAKTAVSENAFNGVAFNSGWIAPNATINVSSKPMPTDADRQTNAYTGITINPANGIITITYTDKIDQGSPTLLLIPKSENTALILGKPPKPPIEWECHSATALQTDTFPQLLGTLNPKHTPVNCRA